MNPMEAGQEILEILEKNNYEAYLVGGCVRDLLLSRPIHDIDLCTSATPLQVMALFDHTIPTGLKHGTVTVIWKDTPFEVTTFRTEGRYDNYRSPQEVAFVQSLSEDLKRRDFTMNAMAMDKEGTLYDDYGGRIDLEKKIINTVGSPWARFDEDALRILRAIRFSAQLNFRIHPEVVQAIAHYRNRLPSISIERITIEFTKVMAAPFIKQALLYLNETKITEDVFPFYYIKEALPQLLSFPIQELTVEERWAFLLFLQKHVSGPKNTFQLIDSFSLPKIFVHKVKELACVLYDYRHISSMSELSPLELFYQGEGTILSLIRVNQIKRDGHLDNQLNIELQTELHKLYQSLPIRDSKQLDITGRDLLHYLNREAGPWIQKLLENIIEKILLGELENKKKKILSYILEREGHELN